MFDLLAQGTNYSGGGAIVGGVGFIFVGLLALAALAIWIWALVDCIGNTSLDGTMKIVWVLVIIFCSTLGAIIYLIFGRSGGRLA